MKLGIKSALLVGLSYLPVAAIAEGHIELADGHFELNAGAIYTDYDNNRNLNDDPGWGVGAGYVFNPQWTVETWYFDTSTDANAGGDVDNTEYRLDTLYHFNPIQKWIPFIVGGVGDNNFDPNHGDNYDETRVNLGLGVKRMLSENWGLRGDVRAFNGLDSEETDYGILVALSYKFGVKSEVAKDSDHDGVMDANDDCFDTTPGLVVDSRGCPVEETVVVDEITTVELAVFFETDSSVVQKIDYSDIQELSDYLKNHPGTVVEIQGHTDSVGTAAYNKSLSQRRAQSIVDILVNDYGVPKARIEAQGYGEEYPIASNDTADGRAKNRRVIAETTSLYEIVDPK